MKLINMVILIASFVSAVGVICAFINKVINKVTDKAFNPVNMAIKELDKRECRMWLVDFLSDIENGIEKDEVQYKFAHEVYDHYRNDLNGNSYIHDKWERVMK